MHLHQSFCLVAFQFLGYVYWGLRKSLKSLLAVAVYEISEEAGDSKTRSIYFLPEQALG